MMKKNYPFILIIFAICLLFFADLFYPIPKIFFTPENVRGDIWYLNYPEKDFLGKSFKSGHLPLWSKDVAGGSPIFAEGQVGTFNIFNIIFYSLFPTWLAFNLSYMFSFIFVFLGSFLYFRKKGIESVSAFLASFSFAFGGFFIGHILHLNLLQVASFLPWLLLFVENYWENPTRINLVLTVLVMSQAMISGHIQMFVILFIGVFILWMSYSIRSGPDVALRRLVYLAVASLIATAISSVQLIPTIEFFLNSKRVATLENANLFSSSFGYKDFIRFIFPYFAQTDISWEKMGYVGLVPLTFLLFVFVKKRKTSFEIFLYSCFVVGLVIILGDNSPFLFLYYLPVLNYFRENSRIVVLLTFSITGLFAINLDWFLEKIRKRFGKPVKIIILTLIFIFVFYDLFKFGYNFNPKAPVDEVLKDPQVLQFIPKGSRVFTHASHNISYYQFAVNHARDAIYPYIYFRNGLEANSNMIFNVNNIRFYSGFSIMRETLYERMLDDNLLDASSVEYMISTEELNLSKNLGMVGKVESESPGLPVYYVYRNLNALPKFRFVSKYEVRPFRKDSYQTTDGKYRLEFKNIGYNFANAVILEDEIGREFDNLSLEDVSVLEDSDVETVIKTNTDKDALLVISDSYYPGWRAKINDKLVPIMPANVNQRAIVVPGGVNTIRIYYQPNSLLLGEIISTLGIILLIFIVRKKEVFL